MKPSVRWMLPLAAVLAVAAAGCNGDSAFTQPEVACGGFQGIGCPVGEVCELPPGECQTSDLAGVCVQRPEACTLEFEPVCGCDGVTYGNDCERLMVGVQKDRDGEC